MNRGGTDPNSFTDFERVVLTSVTQMSWPRSFVALSLRYQLQAMLGARVGHFQGVRDWLGREVRGETLIIRPHRVIGGEYGMPPCEHETDVRVRFSVGGTRHLAGALTLRQSIVRMEMPTAEAARGRLSLATAVSVELDDDLEYWRERRSLAGDLHAVADSALEALTVGRFLKNFVVAWPGLDSARVSLVVPTGSSYGRLLCYANGIRINDLCVWGLVDPLRTFEEGGRKYLYVGDDPKGLIGLRVSGVGAGDDLVRVHSSGRIEGIMGTLSDLCRAAMT